MQHRHLAIQQSMGEKYSMMHKNEYGTIKHMIMMAIACGGAFLLILVLPIIGLSKNWSAGISIAFMIGLHLWIMRRHSDHGHHKEHKGDAK